MRRAGRTRSSTRTGSSKRACASGGRALQARVTVSVSSIRSPSVARLDLVLAMAVRARGRLTGTRRPPSVTSPPSWPSRTAVRSGMWRPWGRRPRRPRPPAARAALQPINAHRRREQPFPRCAGELAERLRRRLGRRSRRWPRPTRPIRASCGWSSCPRVDFKHPERSQRERTRREDHRPSSTGYGTGSPGTMRARQTNRNDSRGVAATRRSSLEAHPPGDRGHRPRTFRACPPPSAMARPTFLRQRPPGRRYLSASEARSRRRAERAPRREVGAAARGRIRTASCASVRVRGHFTSRAPKPSRR